VLGFRIRVVIAPSVPLTFQENGLYLGVCDGMYQMVDRSSEVASVVSDSDKDKFPQMFGILSNFICLPGRYPGKLPKPDFSGICVKGCKMD
jgi:hypothetical protein